MGLLVNGLWCDEGYDTAPTGGRFERDESAFRDAVSTDSQSRFLAQANRYVLYVSYACPWAHRALIARKLKGLEFDIAVIVVHPHMLGDGWHFSSDANNEFGIEAEPLYGLQYLHQLYTRAKSDYSGRVTVPVLWDKATHTIVNNESSEIIRMLNTAFAEQATNAVLDLYPADLRSDIDEINAEVYKQVNNGVYRCGFATTQSAYEEAFDALFGTLDRLEQRLGKQDYLVGNTLTEADIRLYTTLVRFDSVYYLHFKCNHRRIADYPALASYLRRLYGMEAFAQTTHFDHIKQHYYYSHRDLNPHQIVPKGPVLDLNHPD